LLAERLPTTELRAGPIIGSGSASFEMVRYLTERLPVMITPRWVDNEVQPIGISDVLSYLRLALERPALGAVDIGANVLTFRRMMEEYAEVRGLRQRADIARRRSRLAGLGRRVAGAPEPGRGPVLPVRDRRAGVVATRRAGRLRRIRALAPPVTAGRSAPPETPQRSRSVASACEKNAATDAGRRIGLPILPVKRARYCSGGGRASSSVGSVPVSEQPSRWRFAGALRLRNPSRSAPRRGAGQLGGPRLSATRRPGRRRPGEAAIPSTPVRR